jgi:HEAT repeat protein
MKIFKIPDEPLTVFRYSLFIFFTFQTIFADSIKDEFKEEVLNKKTKSILKIYEQNRQDLVPFLKNFIIENKASAELESSILFTYQKYQKEINKLDPEYWKTLESVIENSKNEENVLLALEIVSNLKEKKVIYSILDLVTSRNSEIRRASYKVINSYKDDRTLPYILELGNSDEPIKRYYYLEALNFIQDERANIHIQRLLNDPSPAIRSEAIIAIEKLELKEKLNHVLNMATNDSNYEVRKFAVVSLKNQRSKFPSTVYQKTIFDSNSEVREVSIEAIQTIKDPNYAKFVSLAMEKETLSSLNMKMIEALLHINNHGGGNGLAVVLKKDKDEDVRTKAATAIGNLKASIAIPDLIKSLLTEQVVKVKLAVTKSIGNLKEKTAVPTILNRIQANEPIELKLEFLSALDKIDDPKVMPVIFDLAEEGKFKNIHVPLKQLLRRMLYRFHGGEKGYKILSESEVSSNP